MEQLKIIFSKKILNILVLSLCLTAVSIIVKSFVGDGQQETEEEFSSPDTFIPSGHVLVPIRVSNFDSLSGLVDRFAVVNLYTGNEFQKKPELVAAGVKLIRSAIDTNHFAVLVKDEDSYSIVKKDMEFFVTIQNPNHLSNIKVKKKKVTRVQYLD